MDNEKKGRIGRIQQLQQLRLDLLQESIYIELEIKDTEQQLTLALEQYANELRDNLIPRPVEEEQLGKE